MQKLKSYIPILTCALLLLLCNTQAVSQDKLTQLAKLKTNYVDSIKQVYSDTVLYMPFGFNRFELKDTDSTLKNVLSTAWKIDLVFSTFKLSESFNQAALNQKRFKELQHELPELFSNENISWQVIGETGHHDLQSAKKLYSGFVFHLIPMQEEVDNKAEAAKFIASLLPFSQGLLKKSKTYELVKTIKEKEASKSSSSFSNPSKSYVFNCLGASEKALNGVVVNSYRQKISPPIKKKPSIKGGDQALYKHIAALFIEKSSIEIKRKKKTTAIYSFQVNSDGIVTTSKKKSGNTTSDVDSNICKALREFNGFKKGDLSKRLLEFNIVVNFSKSKQKVPYLSIPTYALVSNLSLCSLVDTSGKNQATSSSYLIEEYSSNEEVNMDSTVMKVLNRNQQWKKMMVVADLTGSMSPYIAQLLIWFKQQSQAKEKRINYISFFNDGDSKPDFQKKMGKVGGIYSMRVTPNSFDSIVLLAEATILSGCGGDIQENNIEAILTSLQRYQNFDELVMIADNYATPRDLKLAASVHKPIKLILCGTEQGINTNYLNLIRENGGSLHTMQHDISVLMKMKEGEKLQVDSYEYILRDGKYQRNYKN